MQLVDQQNYFRKIDNPNPAINNNFNKTTKFPDNSDEFLNPLDQINFDLGKSMHDPNIKLNYSRPSYLNMM